MEEPASSRAFRDESAKSTKSVKLSAPVKPDRDQQMPSPQTISQTRSQASSVSVNAREIKIEDKLNYYHLVELNELFKVLILACHNARVAIIRLSISTFISGPDYYYYYY